MSVDLERRRVLVTADATGRPALRALFAHAALAAWKAVEAAGVEPARSALQRPEVFDALLLDEGVYRREPGRGLGWLMAQPKAPVVLLADLKPDEATSALAFGVHQWLPRRPALANPGLLAAARGSAARVTEVRRRAQAAGEALFECRRQVNRLVGLLWEAPAGGRTRWLPHRAMMERLDEEVARSERHGAPLAVVLGELRSAVAEGPLLGPHLAAWTAEQVSRVKRRSDAAGQFGPNGFMMILPHTSETGAERCCERMRDALERAPASGLEAPVRAYLGAAGSVDGDTPDGLLRRAEERLEESRTTVPLASCRGA